MNPSIDGRLRRAALFGFVLAIPALAACTTAGGTDAPGEEVSHVMTLPMQLGRMADYGATPWYTESIALGSSPMRLALDSGASFFWATSDRCRTGACNAHEKVDTGQPGFTWVDTTPAKRSFGPWGTMVTWTGRVPVLIGSGPYPPIDFFASVDYSGPKFEYLAWGGGVGLPSESSQVTPGSGFLMGALYYGGAVPRPEFSMLTERSSGAGYTWLGGMGDPSLFVSTSEIRLQPKKAAIGYLWGTDLYSVRLGGVDLPALEGQTFFLDSGSSRFKGDAAYLYPIMEPLSQRSSGMHPATSSSPALTTSMGTGPASITRPAGPRTIRTCRT